MYFSANIIEVVSGVIVAESNDILKILLVSVFFIVPSIMLGYPFLGALGYKKDANYSVIIASIVHFIGLVTLFSIDKVSGMSIATLVILTEFIVLFLRCYGVRKHKLWL